MGEKKVQVEWEWWMAFDQCAAMQSNAFKPPLGLSIMGLPTGLSITTRTDRQTNSPLEIEDALFVVSEWTNGLL